MTSRDRIVIDPEVPVGKPVIKGTRLAVDFIIDLLAQGWSEEDILKNYPGLTHADIRACLGYAGTQPLVGQASCLSSLNGHLACRP
jgi:uncharacterized protein (DUF433 family)